MSDHFEQLVDQITKELAETLKRKNHDYGDSFRKIYEEYGDISTAIRLEDKLSRYKTLIQKGVHQKVSDESIDDTLLDHAGYAILTLVQRRSPDPKADIPLGAPVNVTFKDDRCHICKGKGVTNIGICRFCDGEGYIKE